MKVRIDITGTSPLLMHNIQLADPMNPIAKSMKAVSSKRKKTDEDYVQLAELEFKGGLYHSEDIGPFIPGVNVQKSIIDGGRITKQGKQVERGLLVIDNELPLLYRGPRDVEALWSDINYRNVSAVKVGMARVMRTRPQFRQWAVECDVEVDPGLLSIDVLQSILNDAGSMVGIGDYRPRFGRYVALVSAL